MAQEIAVHLRRFVSKRLVRSAQFTRNFRQQFRALRFSRVGEIVPEFFYPVQFLAEARSISGFPRAENRCCLMSRMRKVNLHCPGFSYRSIPEIFPN
jgi:hypothetical protein